MNTELFLICMTRESSSTWTSVKIAVLDLGDPFSISLRILFSHLILNFDNLLFDGSQSKILLHTTVVCQIYEDL